MPNWAAIIVIVVNIVLLSLAIAYNVLAMKQDFRSRRLWQHCVTVILIAALSSLVIINLGLLWERI